MTVPPDAMARFIEGAGRLGNLLPDPDGMMMAAVVYDYTSEGGTAVVLMTTLLRAFGPTEPDTLAT